MSGGGWEGVVAFPCFFSIEPSDSEKSRFPLSLLQPVTSINAAADERANTELSQPQTHEGGEGGVEI